MFIAKNGLRYLQKGRIVFFFYGISRLGKYVPNEFIYNAVGQSYKSNFF